MAKTENEAMGKISSPWKMVAYLVRYRTKEILALVVLVLIGVILMTNIAYDKKNGFQWRPWTVEVKK